jgi:hypothetical protein
MDRTPDIEDFPSPYMTCDKDHLTPFLFQIESLDVGISYNVRLEIQLEK